MKLARTPGIGATLSFGALGLGAALGLLAHGLVAQMLGPAGTGAVLLATTFIGVGATFARAGLDNVVLRQAAVLQEAGDELSLMALHRRSVAIVLCFSFAVAAVLAAAAPHWRFTTNMPVEFATAMQVLAVALPATSFLVLQGEFVKACGRPVVATVLQSALAPLFVALVLVITWLSAVQPTVTMVASVMMGGTIGAAACAAFAWRPKRHDADARAKILGAGELLRMGRPFLFVAGMNLALAWTDIIVLSIWTDAASLGIYGVAAKAASAISFLLIACNSVTAPRYATLHANRDQPGMQRLATVSTFWLTVAAAPAVLLIFVFASQVMAVFGPEFSGGGTVLRVLVVGQAVNVATGSVGYLLLMTGHERQMRTIISTAAAFNVVGNLMLVPWLGPTGAGLATAATLAGMNIACFLAVRRLLGVNTLGYLQSGGSPWRL